MHSDSTLFTHAVTSAGPAQGMTLTGRQRLAPPGAETRDLPLVIAIHGGAYTSGYFDVPGYSFLHRAESIGVPIIAIDRPGYGGSDPVASDDSIFLANAAILDHVITELWESLGKGTAGVVVVGHSLGAVISLAIAARKPTWPLLGIAISGMLVRPPEGLEDIWAGLPDRWNVPAEVKSMLMFGREWTRRTGMPEASVVADVPVITAELVEVAIAWESKLFPAIMPEIDVPVFLRQGEFDTLSVTDEAQVAEFAAALTASPLVDAQLFRAAGHAIDFERASAAFQTQQLAFALTLAAQSVLEHARPPA